MGARKSKTEPASQPAKDSAVSDANSIDFEKAMAELEDLVRRLEAGDQPLEESLSVFEKGVGLVKTLHRRLDAVQTRIDELVQGADGSVKLSPLAVVDDDEQNDEEGHL